MKIQKIMKALIFTLFVIGGSFFTLTLFPNGSSGDNESETGTITGTVKVSRARHSGNVVVYLESKSLKKEYPPLEKHSTLDQKNLVFSPRVLPILKGTTVDFLNSDDVQHNIFAPGKVEKFNLGTWGLGGTRSYAFNKPGEVVVLCNVHSEMVAYIVVLENPYFVKTEKEGNFRMENIPPGTYQLKTWHEKMKSAPQEVTIAKGEIKEIHLELKKRK